MIDAHAHAHDAADPPRPRAAVLGRPIAHSLSPVLHAAAYRALGLDVHYDRHDLGVAEVGPFLAGTVNAAAGPWLGVSVTMPLKAAVVPYADVRSERVARLGVANTLVRDHPEHPGAVLAENTDVDGIVSALGDGGLDVRARGGVLGILGNGGTATAAVEAAGLLGADGVRLGVRDATRATEVRALAERQGLAVEITDQADLVTEASDLRALVATLPPRAADPLAPGVPASGLPPLLDAAYDPWPSALARAWEAAGGGVVSGVSMLLHQGVAQARLFTARLRAGTPEPDWSRVTSAAAAALGLPAGASRTGHDRP